jgi:hypothetical protein
MRRPGAARRIDSADSPVGIDSATDIETSQTSGASETILSGLSRRLFLTRSSLTVVAAGVVSALPALPSAVTAAETEAPAADSAVSDTDALSGPLIAHVKDLQTGEVSLYSGEREFSIVDRGLAAKLFNAAK